MGGPLKAIIKIDDPCDGAENMRRDWAMWQQAQEQIDDSFFSLRIYQWKRPTISHGFAQKPEKLFDFSQIQRDKVDIVARCTGGKALLHHHEMTYALATNFNHQIFGGSLLESYQKVAQGLCLFLHNLGIKSDISVNKSRKKSPMEGLTPLCYASVGFMEIELDGKKFIGSAQKRGNFGYLQHGSIPIAHSLHPMCRYLLDKRGQQEPEVAVLSDYLALADLDFRLLAGRLAETFVHLLAKYQKTTCLF